MEGGRYAPGVGVRVAEVEDRREVAAPYGTCPRRAETAAPPSGRERNDQEDHNCTSLQKGSRRGMGAPPPDEAARSPPVHRRRLPPFDQTQPRSNKPINGCICSQ